MSKLYNKSIRVILSTITAGITICYAEKLLFPPRPSGPVADYAGLLDKSTKIKINSVARSLWIDSKFGLIVATVSSTDTFSIEAYACSLFCIWGAGSRKDTQNALMLLSVSPPGIHIELSRDARRYLNESETEKILESKGIPCFNKGEYSKGIINVINTLSVIIKEKNQNVKNEKKELGAGRFSMSLSVLIRRNSLYFIGFVIIIVLIVAAYFYIRASSSARVSRYSSTRFGGGSSSGSFGGCIPFKRNKV